MDPSASRDRSMAPKRKVAPAAPTQPAVTGPARKRAAGRAHTRVTTAAADLLGVTPHGASGPVVIEDSDVASPGLTAANLLAHTHGTKRKAHDTTPTCAICGSAVADKRASTNLVCDRCIGVWKHCFRGTDRAEFVEQASKNKAMQELVTHMSTVLADPAAAQWAPTTVTCGFADGERTEKRFIGLSREEFKDIFGLMPEAIGIKASQLVDEFGRTYRGVLLQDPQQPWRYHTFSHRRGHALVTAVVLASAGASEELAHTQYDATGGLDIKDRSALAKKVWSKEEITAKVQAHHEANDEQEKAVAAASAAEHFMSPRGKGVPLQGRGYAEP